MKNNAVVLAVSKVAARLHATNDTAKRLTLVARNAEIIVARAGHVSKSFRPIAQNINELAAKIIADVAEIDQLATAIAQRAVDVWRSERFVDALSDAIRLSRAEHQHPMIDLRAVGERDLSQHRKEIASDLQTLRIALMQFETMLYESNMIATIARIEASRAGEYEANFTNVANSIATTVTTVIRWLDECDELLASIH